jgi:cytochrome c biogenesis protein CcdA
VPVNIILDFLANHSRWFHSIAIYRDALFERYKVLYEDGSIVECDNESALFESIGNTRTSLQFFTVFPLIIVSGLIDSINPCAFAVMFFFLAFLYMARRDSSEDVRPKVRLVGTVYIIGVYISYLLIGLAVIDVFMITPFPNLIKTIVAALVIFLGAVNVKDYFWPGKWLSLKIPKSRWRTIAGWMHKFTIPSAFVVGLLVSVVEFPCTGGVYLGILGLLASSATFTQGLTYLMIYNVMFVLPLIIILIVSSNKRVVEKMRAWNISQEKPMRLISGLVMVLMGVYLLLSAF